ncbi:MAG: hypothetical protein WA364_24840 [Candidatus Nitrosopolaris sp.]
MIYPNYAQKEKKESFNGTNVTHYLLRSKQCIAILSIVGIMGDRPIVGIMGDRPIVKRFIPEVPS